MTSGAPVGTARAADGGVTYRLADTWADAPWSLTAGRYGQAADVSSAPDGTVYVLDSRNGAVHVLEPDGRPRDVFVIDPALAADGFVPRRIDVGFNGAIHVLVDSSWPRNGTYQARVYRFEPNRKLTMRIDLETPRPSEYRDVAARADGRVYLTRIRYGALFTICERPTIPFGNGVEVFGPDGVYLERIESLRFTLPESLDVEADGTLFVVNKLPGMFCPPPGPPPPPPPSLLSPLAPEPTVAGDHQPQAPAQLAEPEEGVMIFAPDHAWRETVPFNGADDVAVGPAGVFVARNVEIFALRESDPLYTGPTGQVFSAYLNRVALRLDVPADGRLLASMAHCAFQGLMIFDDPTARPAPARYVGALDQPELEGPHYPVKLDASRQVAVLQGLFGLLGQGPDRRRFTTTNPTSPQTVQRWTRYGALTSEQALTSQLGVCSGDDGWSVRDVAIDGDAVYTVNPSLVQYRPHDLLPAWTVWPAARIDPDAGSRLTAASAHDGRVAVLDGGTGLVYLLDAAGDMVDHWPIGIGGANALPVDIAFDGERVFLADLGRGRISVRATDGADLGEWPVHDGPVGIAVGPSGDVFMLGRGGWGYRYAPDGQLVASWPMPDRSIDALDIAVDVDGSVYVSYVALVPFSGTTVPGRAQPQQRIDQAGIWVFEAAPAELFPVPETGACLASPDKWAAPRRLPLGETTGVHLTVNGRCPGALDPVQIAVVLDTSRSMNFDSAFGRAQDALLALLGELDPHAAEVALVSYDEGAVLELPLSRDLAGVAARVSGLEAWGNTRLTSGIEAAVSELTGPRADPAARRVLLIVTDGMPKDAPQDAAADARAAGLELYALLFPTYEFNSAYLALLQFMTADASRVLNEPNPAQLRDMAREMVRFRPEPGLFETIRVVDEVPANMRYVDGSATPAAVWDPAARTLTWALGRVDAARPIRLDYRLQPLEVGTWPTNVQATAPYRDVLGSDATLVFPIPEVDVYTFDYAAYVPYGAAKSCLRRLKPVDVALVVDTSSSMGEAAPGGGTKLDAAGAATRVFLDQLQWSLDRAVLVSFDRQARRETGLTGDRPAVEAAVDRLTTRAGTRIDLGLAEARRALAEGGRMSAVPVVILLTDGLNNDGPDPVRAEAAALREAGVTVFTIGLGADVDGALLTEVATEPSGYYASPTADDLASIYRRISERLGCGG